MKRLLIIGVNYNSYEALKKFVKSIDYAASAIEGIMQIDVAIADNTESQQQTIENIYPAIHLLKIYQSKNNAGYFGGALPLYNKLNEGYDFVAISNVDLQLKSDFFLQLNTIELRQDIAWIAPDIYTKKNKRHENPYMLKRPDKKKFMTWRIIYSNTLIYRFYHFLYRTKTLFINRKQLAENTYIYAGHGSFILLSKSFVKYYPTLEFPSYMYGEEIFIAELIKQAKLKVKYISQLKIDNDGNINTNTIGLNIKSKWSIESLKTIEQLFFK